jgi:hypothetical protein
MTELIVPSFIRGRLYDQNLVRFGGRGGDAEFLAPDPSTIIDMLPLANPGDLRDLYSITFAEIVDYLVELGTQLSLRTNIFLQEALEQSYAMADQTPPLLRWQYDQLPQIFQRDFIMEAAELPIGIRYLEGWVPTKMTDGRLASIRAMGSRAVHVVAGNSPVLSGITILRNAITRSDAIIKAPSNDPLTGLAIARTMHAMAPNHPLTKHVSVAYWKGGSCEFEGQLYSPRNLEKIVAWGGLASVKHVRQFIQPGLELITLDPKRSATVIGPEAFADDRVLQEVAVRLATDIGAWNQLACCAARVVFVASGTGDAGLERLNRLGDLVYRAMVDLPPQISTKPKRYDPELRAQVVALRTSPDFYRVIGGADGEGAIVVSQTPEPVDFHTSLSGRTANLVPMDDVREAFGFMNAYTQTVGIFPETLKTKLRDAIPLYGAQRLVTLGYANAGSSAALPQDAIEPIRRMVRWIVDETCEIESVPPLWIDPKEKMQPMVVA